MNSSESNKRTVISISLPEWMAKAIRREAVTQGMGISEFFKVMFIAYISAKAMTGGNEHGKQ